MTDFTAKAEELVKTWRGDGCYTGTHYELAAQVAAALEAAYAQGVEDAAKVADKSAACNCGDYVKQYTNYHEPNAAHVEAEEIAAEIRALVKDGAK